MRITHGEAVLEILTDIMKLYLDCNVRKFAESLTKPLERNGIDSISFTDDAGVGEIATKFDLSSFVVPDQEDE